MNKYFFDKIDSEKKAYWLGFLYADGYNGKNKIGVRLAIIDKKHIEKFCKSIEHPECKIKILPPRIINYKGRIIHGSGSAEVNLYSKYLSSASSNVGLIHKKSLILTFPNDDIVPDYLLNHFIRGYFDGDGCLTKGYNNHATRYRVIILSTKNFCENLCIKSNSVLNIRMKMWDKKKTNVYKICVSGNRQVKTFMDWLYKDSTIWLDRKYELYKELCEKIINIDKKLSDTSSKYNNITFDKSRSRWVANVRMNKKTVHVGRFDTEADAFAAQQTYITSFSREMESNQNASPFG